MFHSDRYSSKYESGFPSPCGVWVVSVQAITSSCLICFRPLAGCGLFPELLRKYGARGRFPSPCGVWVVSTMSTTRQRIRPVSVPLQGVGCFGMKIHDRDFFVGFRPLAGCGLFHDKYTIKRQGIVFPSPCGVWVVSMAIAYGTEATKFPSPCGVWVVSYRMQILK